jgi:hypothetical protein
MRNTAMDEQLYKLTAADGSPVHGGSGKWPVPTEAGPGKWRSVRGDLVPCSVGLHLLRVQDIPIWLRAGTLWLVEAGPERIDHGDKIVVRKARLVREAAVIDDTMLRLLAADFAEHVLSIFEEKHPGDLRPREAIAAARAYARGEIGLDKLRSAYVASASAAAAAARYAASAAYAAAYAASTAASARYAASAAAYARSKERAWQVARVAEVLGLE